MKSTWNFVKQGKLEWENIAAQRQWSCKGNFIESQIFSID